MEKETNNYDNEKNLWSEFLETWPLERIKRMTLEEYTSAGSKDSFTYWIESKLEALGSIWGGSAFKFGIYSRNNKENKDSTKGRIFSDNYGWNEKYGRTEHEVFNRVKMLIVAVIEAVQKKDLAKIDDIDLGSSYKWKIASLYQDQYDPKIVTIFNNDALEYISGLKIKAGNFSELYKQIIKEKPSNLGILEYSEIVWQKYVNELRIWKVSHGQRDFTKDERKKLLDEKKIVVHGETPKEQGKNFLEKARIGDYFYLCHGNDEGIKLFGKIISEALDSEKGIGWKHREYQIIKESNFEKKYNGKQKGWAPNYNSTFMQVKVNELALYNKEISIPYFGIDIKAGNLSGVIENQQINNSEKKSKSINQILYGPPGTGKTYETISRAVQIVDDVTNEEFNEIYPTREDVRKKYQEYIDKKKIRFVTFHQSFSYEDFVEGIKPVLAKDKKDDISELGYKIEYGIFKSICKDAQFPENTTFESAYNKLLEDLVESQRKITLDLNGEEIAIYSHPNGIDLKVDSSIYMKNITKEGLEYTSRSNIFAGVWGKYYRGIFKLLSNKYGYIQNQSEAIGNFVLIIDEINRGNIASIFGELITLIEPDKRKGASEELEVLLPYSKSKFSVPNNVYIIGTMNTADRSVEALDTALRRRFDFLEVKPNPEILSPTRLKIDDPEFKEFRLDIMLEKINKRIERLLDADHCIGHAYFMSLADVEDPLLELRYIFKNKIIPLLKEYFYGDLAKIGLILGKDFIEYENINDKGKIFADFDYDNKDEFEEIKPIKIKELDMIELSSFRKIYE